jgi:UDP-GlcNAc:undecaprenyl-phosphate GlcNAc-1-phosphate transferase
MSLVGSLLAFSLTTALIVLLRPLAISFGLVDIPSGRKSHSGHIPFIAAFIASPALYFFQIGAHEISSISLNAFFSAGLILVVVGAWDDYRDRQ